MVSGEGGLPDAGRGGGAVGRLSTSVHGVTIRAVCFPGQRVKPTDPPSQLHVLPSPPHPVQQILLLSEKNENF